LRPFKDNTSIHNDDLHLIHGVENTSFVSLRLVATREMEQAEKSVIKVILGDAEAMEVVKKGAGIHHFLHLRDGNIQLGAERPRVMIKGREGAVAVETMFR
jgi:hypothetical protein